MSILVRDRKFYRDIAMIGGPIAAQQIITVGVNMMDTIMLGQLDEVSLSAGSMAVQVHNLYHFMGMGLSMGASVLLTRYLGAKEERSIRKTLAIQFRLALLLAAVFTAVCAAVPEKVMRLLTSDPEVIRGGVSYLRWALPCFLLYGLTLNATNVLRSCRQLRIPLFTSIGAFFINIGANWIFIFGKCGAPAMGVAGAALGTLISRIFEFSVICGWFFLKDRVLRFRPRDLLTPSSDLLPEYLRIALPVMLSDTLLGLGNTAVTSVAGHIGRTFMSANTITQVTQHVSTVFSAGLGQSALIITGHTLGTGDREKAQTQGWSFLLVGLAVGAAAGGLVILLGPAAVSFYKVEPETAKMARELMNAYGLVTVFMMCGSILTKGVLRGGGDTRFLMAADIAFLWCVSVPLGYLAGIVWHWPAFWILFCLKIDHLAKVILCTFRLRSGKWMKNIRAV